jgi:hypothetical protein
MKQLLAFTQDLTKQQTVALLELLNDSRFRLQDVPSSLHFLKKAKAYNLQILATTDYDFFVQQDGQVGEFFCEYADM